MGKAFIILANGMAFAGQNFGAQGTSVGEVVFNTGMAGYEETLTDPSYYGQIITQTYPLIGNYGVNGQDAESRKIWAFGYIVREICDTPSNFRCTGTLDAYLKAQGIIGVSGVDTRRLTRIIRESGVMNGALTTEYETAQAALGDAALMARIQAYTVCNAVDTVTTNSIEIYENNSAEMSAGQTAGAAPGGDATAKTAAYHVALYDFGYKQNILRNLTKRGCKVSLVPARTTAAQLAGMGIDGVMLSNGPGDPAENTDIIRELRQVAALGKPIFGICLGHQLMALAMGAKTQKLKYGHRGVNQPVTDFAKDRTYITSQNHGYAVVGDTVDEGQAEVSHVNANDKTVEGVRYKHFPCFTVQFHPEACGGPCDTEYLFDALIAMMAEQASTAAGQPGAAAAAVCAQTGNPTRPAHENPVKGGC